MATGEYGKYLSDEYGKCSVEYGKVNPSQLESFTNTYVVNMGNTYVVNMGNTYVVNMGNTFILSV